MSDSLVELKHARTKISLLRADSLRFILLNATLIIQLKQSRELTSFYKERWETVEKLFIVKQKRTHIKIIPKGRLKSLLWDFTKFGLGFLTGKLQS